MADAKALIEEIKRELRAALMRPQLAPQAAKVGLVHGRDIGHKR